MMTLRGGGESSVKQVHKLVHSLEPGSREVLQRIVGVMREASHLGAAHGNGPRVSAQRYAAFVFPEFADFASVMIQEYDAVFDAPSPSHTDQAEASNATHPLSLAA